MTDISMTKSELIERIVAAQARSSNAQLNSKDVEFAVKTMLEQMSQTLASGDRIEIRGFGSCQNRVFLYGLQTLRSGTSVPTSS